MLAGVARWLLLVWRGSSITDDGEGCVEEVVQPRMVVKAVWRR